MRASGRLLIIVVAAVLVGGCTPVETGGTAVTTTALSDSEMLTVVGDLAYMSGDERFRGAAELLDLVVPADPGGPWPVVVVLHGNPRLGGKQWSMPMAKELASHGRVVFLPDWGHTSFEWRSEGTLREQWDSIVAGLRCAVAFAKAVAPEYGGDPDHITVMGYSAGGNAALMAAMSDVDPPESCVVRTAGVEPQAVVSIEGDLLIIAPVWDQEFAQDPDAFYSLAPWRLLNPEDRFPVHVLAAADTTGAERSLAGSDPYTTFLASRHADIDLIAELDAMGILDDGILTNLEAQEWAHQTLLNAGYETSWALLPESRHADFGDSNWAMSDSAWQLTIDIVLNAEHPHG